MALPDVEFFKPQEVAGILRCRTAATVIRHCKAGHIRHTRVGREYRIARAEVERIVAAMAAGMPWEAPLEDVPTAPPQLSVVAPTEEQIEWVTTAQAAELLGRSERQVQRMVHAGKLRARTGLKPFLVAREDCEALKRAA